MDAEYREIDEGVENGRNKGKSIELFLDEEDIDNLREDDIEAELEDKNGSRGEVTLRYDPDYGLTRVGISQNREDEYELVVGDRILSKIEESGYDRKVGKYQEESQNTRIKINSKEK